MEPIKPNVDLTKPEAMKIVSESPVPESGPLVPKPIMHINAVDPVVLNRRYNKLQEMIENDDDYFSEEAIRSRDPLLYHLYVGKYRRHGDIPGNKNPTLSEVLFQAIDTQDQEEELEKAKKLYKKMTGHHYFTKKQLKASKPLTKEELEDNEDELIQIMHYRFLRGEDKGLFNYEEVDNNEKYDDRKTAEQDLEDKYFESEEQSTGKKEGDESKYTGELDY